MDKKEAINYLTNFWEHKEGSQLLVNDLKKKITSIDSEYPEQVTIEDSDRIYYIQDHQWSPTMNEIFEIMEDQGVKVLNDSLMFRKTFKAKPQNIIEAAKTFVELRVSHWGKFGHNRNCTN